MKKTLLFVLILLLSVSLFGCSGVENNAQPRDEEEQKQTGESYKEDKEEVASLVESFGSKLQKVSLLAPKEILEKSMQENYSEFVAQELIAEWVSDPLNAPGRQVSSPWPDRIEILNIEKLSEDLYEVKGEIIELTSVELVQGGYASSRPITLMVEKIEDNWLITAVTLGKYEEPKSIIYTNTQYGFNFSLPKSWEGYIIVTEKWESSIPGKSESNVVETGPMIYIRHPEWTSENVRQDIPIMIFDLNQWESLKRGDFGIGAAGIEPRELGRNSKYVFALPARYNYSFPIGYEEVDNILQNNSLKPIE